MTVIYIYCVNCTKFGQLILRKVIQIVVTRCHIVRLKMHQIRFRLGLRPRPLLLATHCLLKNLIPKLKSIHQTAVVALTPTLEMPFAFL